MFDLVAARQLLDLLQSRGRICLREDATYYGMAIEMEAQGHLQTVERKAKKVRGNWLRYRGYELTPQGRVFAQYLNLA